MAQSYDQIQRQISALQRQADSLRNADVKKAIDSIKIVIKKFSLTAEQLGLGASASGKQVPTVAPTVAISTIAPAAKKAPVKAANKVEAIAKKVAPVAKKAAPSVKAVAPVANKVAPAVKHIAPVAKKAALVSKKAAFVAKTAAPVVKQPGPVAKPVVSAKKAAAPVAKKAAPASKAIPAVVTPTVAASSAPAAPATPAEPSVAAASTKPAVKPKVIRFKDGSNEWTGMGPRPKWILAGMAAGRTMESFATGK